MIRKAGLFLAAAALLSIAAVDGQAQYVATHHVRDAVRSYQATPQEGCLETR